MRPAPSPRALAFLGIVAGVVLAARLFLASDPDALLVAWFPDDAFYYLLPAWHAGHGRGFTFDGTTPTLGFQPAWAALLAAMAAAAPSKAALASAALWLGLALHGIAALLLHRWLAREGLRAGALAAALVWTLNPHLLRMQASGMESGLVAVALLGMLVVDAGRSSGKRGAAGIGALLGLAVLARTSAIVAAAPLVARWLRREGVSGAALLGGCAVVAPWCLYATASYGRILPTSMERKLVGGWAAAARTLTEHALVPDRLARAALPAAERSLFDAPALAHADPAALWTLGPQAALGWTLGSWLPTGLDAASWAALAALALGAWGVARARREPGRSVHDATDAARWRVPSALPALVVGAAGYSLLDGLLLPTYVAYGYWYRVPEALAILGLVAVLVERAACGLGPRLGAAAAALALAAGLARGVDGLAPRVLDPASDLVAAGALELADAMSAELPVGTRVASWNAGLLGWRVEGPVIVNVDGLAGAPHFLPVARQEVLFRHGLAESPALVPWLDDHGITYVADLERPATLGARPFYGVVPAERVELVRASRPVRHWEGRGARDHAVVLVRLRDRASTGGRRGQETQQR